ncbi:iron complex transport system ATP-binding protein [Dysgonomonas hofstadii]|uniref:Iron complex transport system ATP-binding protein n=1 Tax=Dysgonomonas hofstadii TaxID=637886 RepID=A0A840CQI3_9BACT|nr:ABC transporter ATP-binding protein [Dysgonomonas hofstadii]MBB4035185.1 iron complex transport system ATP-binding protein [Dysgonomonas hofstadii]
MEKHIIISAVNIGIGYGKTKHRDETALYKGLSFNLYQGELVCLIGANGAGKSTLLRSISNSQPTLNGNIFIQNKDITLYSEKSLSRLLGLVLTDKTATGGLLVKELVELGRYPYTGFFGQINKEDKDVVEKAMTDVGIIHKASSYVAELSDGERQKAMIAKALAQECPIILLDEPTAFLDIESRIEIMNLLHELAINQNKTILLSTHDIDLALLLADRLWLLSKEKGLVSGITEDIILSGIMDNFFKGENVVFDRYSGNFLPNRKSNRKVHIETNNLLLHWTKNLIEKHGYALAIDNDIPLFSIYISSPDNIIIDINGEKTKLNTFEELANWLRNYI